MQIVLRDHMHYYFCLVRTFVYYACFWLFDLSLGWLCQTCAFLEEKTTSSSEAVHTEQASQNAALQAHIRTTEVLDHSR